MCLLPKRKFVCCRAKNELSSNTETADVELSDIKVKTTKDLKVHAINVQPSINPIAESNKEAFIKKETYFILFLLLVSGFALKISLMFPSYPSVPANADHRGVM